MATQIFAREVSASLEMSFPQHQSDTRNAATAHCSVDLTVIFATILKTDGECCTNASLLN